MPYRYIMTWITRPGLWAGALILAAGPAWAAGDQLAAGLGLAQQRQCLGCHQVDARRVGPPFRAIAQRFRDQPQAAQYLAQTMRQGSSRQWGAIPMPAQTRLSEADAIRLAQWILSLPDEPATP
ncbi:MAG: c-type cytochrome [Castellaniella sp.]|uniref:c-type cytochrome n=1 Tax=Castellaniella sp. TaxID=1955812 RepID=UPI003C749D64